MTLRQAYFAPAELVPAEQAVGRISADSLAAYPPGIPNVLPGEVITVEVLNFLRSTAASPFGHVRGAADPAMIHFRVVADAWRPVPSGVCDVGTGAAASARRCSPAGRCAPVSSTRIRAGNSERSRG